jgi:hypothetical protein
MWNPSTRPTSADHVGAILATADADSIAETRVLECRLGTKSDSKRELIYE